MDLAAAGLLSGGRGWSDFLERQQNKKKKALLCCDTRRYWDVRIGTDNATAVRQRRVNKI